MRVDYLPERTSLSHQPNTIAISPPLSLSCPTSLLTSSVLPNFCPQRHRHKQGQLTSQHHGTALLSSIAGDSSLTGHRVPISPTCLAKAEVETAKTRKTQRCSSLHSNAHDRLNSNELRLPNRRTSPSTNHHHNPQPASAAARRRPRAPTPPQNCPPSSPRPAANSATSACNASTTTCC